PDEVEAVAKAIKKCGRPILLSLSPGNKVPMDDESLDRFRMANMLRVTHDIWDDERGIKSCFSAWKRWGGYSKPGFWIDMDMIPFGKLKLMSPPPPDKTKEEISRMRGHGFTRQSKFTKPQMTTFITMRALSASPLMIGGDLPTMDDFSFKLLTNKDMVACNQNGVMGTMKYSRRGNPLSTWVTPKKGVDNAGWIGVFNRSTNDTTVEASAEVLGIEEPDKRTLRDVWGEKSISVGETLEIPAQGAAFIVYE
ncbi:glycoside hydrolase family 27 protein, partial [Verrucomicrobiota bacterium]